MPRRKALYKLQRPKARASWHKINVYNIERMRLPFKPAMTYFQQKWYAKAMTRGYHGDTVKETHWRKMFRPDMRSVVAMNANYLGRFDGSDMSSGRGAGREKAVDSRSVTKRPPRVPYMNMVYHQLERRLDVAIWRAMFASSTKQARQFCVHGGVKVNGRKMIYPGYQLNPGDMFQVEVERVMFATGARKDYWERRYGRQDRRRGYGIVRKTKQSLQEGEAEVAEEELETSTAEPTTAQTEDTPDAASGEHKLRDWLDAARRTLKEPRTKEESTSYKQALRDFTRTLRRELGSKASRETPIDEQIAEMASKLSLDSGNVKTQESTSDGSMQSNTRVMTKTLQADQERMLKEALQRMRENPVDYTKGYKTPWEPRPYMSPFAFIPRYLEVHAPICAAVYLRHPVARNGLGEVPTPFNELVNGLTFNWYLRRR